MGTTSEPDGDGVEVRAEGYETSDGQLVLFDPENPVAWILSDWYGTPPDAEDDSSAE